MDHFKLILPEHLNHYGHLFGGNMLKWLDEFACITANLELPGHQFVTLAMENVQFRHPASGGEIIRFEISRHHLGNTSVQYNARVFGTSRSGSPDVILFETRITFVSIDEEGRKTPIRSELRS